MKVRLQNGGSATADNIRALSLALDAEIPSSYLDFVGKYDGAWPDNNVFNIVDVNQSTIREFIPVRDILSSRLQIDNVPGSAFPIAWDVCGNCVYIDAATGFLYFWDHETSEFACIAEEFFDFIKSLRFFEVSSIELKPTQVLSAWIDPDFLKSLERDN